MKNRIQNIFLFVTLVVLISNNALTQDDIKSDNEVIFSMNADYSKLDYFHNIQLNTELFEFLAIESSIGVNANKTYYLNSFAPQFSLGMGYDLTRKAEKWKVIPMIKSRTTMIDLSQSTRLSYLEGYVGYSIIYGSKWYITHSSFFGRGIEFYKSMNSQVHFWSYSFNLGFGYGF